MKTKLELLSSSNYFFFEQEKLKLDSLDIDYFQEAIKNRTDTAMSLFLPTPPPPTPYQIVCISA